MRRHAHIFRNRQACIDAFKSFIAGIDYQRSESGLWYASRDDTHNFLSADNLDRLLGNQWDTIEIANDVEPIEKAIIMSNCMDAVFKRVKVANVAELSTPQLQGNRA